MSEFTTALLSRDATSIDVESHRTTSKDVEIHLNTSKDMERCRTVSAHATSWDL